MSKTNGDNGTHTALWDDLPALVRLNKNRTDARFRIDGVTQKKVRDNEILRAVILLGGFSEVGRLCTVSPKAVMKWAKLKRLPRTEATGETQYAAIMAKANPEINEEALRKTAFRTRGKVKRTNEIGCPTYR
jgi:hypothetical protein